MALAGIDPLLAARVEDPVEAAVMAAAARRANEVRSDERLELAKLIRSEIAEAWNRGKH